MTATILYVSRNFRDDCSHETRALGETFPYIAAAEQKLAELREALARVQKSESQSADDAASAILSGLSDLLHDSSWAQVVGEAEEAFAEADVVPVKRNAA